MAERMAEVEQGAAADDLTFVLLDDARLAGDRGCDGLRPHSRIAGQDLLAIFFKPGEKAGVLDQPIFDDLGIAGAHLSRIECVEQ